MGRSKALEGADVTSVNRRLQRAAACLVQKQFDRTTGRSTAAYCISMDRGYGNIQAQQRLWNEDGIYSNAIMADNRVGLPRRWLAEVAKDLKCPSSCNHKPDAAGCTKYMWTVMNKPPFELNVWQDSKLIISYGNFFSSSRAGVLSRGNSGSKSSYSVWTPESIFHYNIEGRSATDSADQARRKLAMAERRIERAGQKGMAFVFDIAFSNGAIIQRMLQPQDTKMHTLETKYTKVKFCLRWASAVLASPSTRYRRQQRRVTSRASSRARTPSSVSPVPQKSQSSEVLNMQQHHNLVDLYQEARESGESAKKVKGRPRKKKKALQYGRGQCGEVDTRGNFHKCGLKGAPKRTSYFCEHCRKFYHLKCFFKTHFCRLMQ